MSFPPLSQWPRSPVLWLSAAALVALLLALGLAGTTATTAVSATGGVQSNVVDSEGFSGVSGDAPRAVIDPARSAPSGLPTQPRAESESASVAAGAGPREVRGWVRDIDGSPVMGAVVELSTTIGSDDSVLNEFGQASGSWSLQTEADGVFVFTGAPTGELRLHATALDGTVASAVVPYRDEGITEVILTLEATAWIIVHVDDPRLRDARVIVRTRDPRAHGPGAPPPLTETLDLEAASALGDETTVDSVDAGDNTDDGQGPGYAYSGEGAEELSDSEDLHLAEKARFVTAVEGPLRQWDATDVEGSMGRIFEGIIRSAPAVGAMMASQLEADDFAAAADDPAALGRAMARTMADREPSVALTMGFVAERLRVAPETALVELVDDPEFEREMAAFVEAKEAERRAMTPDSEPAQDAVFQPANFRPEPALEAADAPMEDPAALERGALEIVWGALGELLVPIGEPFEEDVSGQVGAPIAVRTGFDYQVSIAIDAEYLELSCGSVVLVAGETAEWTCGRLAAGTVVGTLIALDGRPVAGARLELRSLDLDERVAEGVSDAAGRFQLRVESMRALSVALNAKSHGAAHEPTTASETEVKRVSLVPGRLQDVGRLVMVAPQTYVALASASDVTEVFMDAGDFIALDDLDGAHPLAELGATSSDVLLRIGGEDATRISHATAMLMMHRRGIFEAGSTGLPVELVMRRNSGEVYRLTLPQLDDSLPRDDD